MEPPNETVPRTKTAIPIRTLRRTKLECAHIFLSFPRPRDLRQEEASPRPRCSDVIHDRNPIGKKERQTRVRISVLISIHLQSFPVHFLVQSGSIIHRSIYSGMNVLVIGAAGMIGRKFCEDTCETVEHRRQISGPADDGRRDNA